MVKYMINKLIKESNIFVLSIIFLMTIVMTFIGIGDKFFTVTNFQSMAFQVAEFGLLALAMSLAMIVGGIDLSIIANAGLSGIIAAYIMSGTIIKFNNENKIFIIIIAIVVCLFVSSLCGFINGILIAKLSISPILATLGTMIFYNGIAMALSDGQSVKIGIREFSLISQYTILKIPIIFIIFSISFIIVYIMLNKTIHGRKLYLLGQNNVTSRFTGHNPEKMLIVTYTCIGFIVGIAALIIISRVNSARIGFGDTYLLQAILVAVLGGINPDGGKGNVFGVFIGICLIQFLQSVFTMLQFSPYVRKLIWGLLLLIVLFVKYCIDNKKYMIWRKR